MNTNEDVAFLIKKVWPWIGPIVWIIIPIALNVVVEKEWFFTLLYNMLNESGKENIQIILQNIDTYVNIFSLIPLAILSARNGLKANNLKDLQITVFEKERATLVAVLQNNGLIPRGIEKNDISVRVFEKKKGKLVFSDIAGCSPNNIRGKNQFDIKSDEGVVTRAYKERKACYEIQNGGADKHHLSDYNQSKFGNLKFIVAIPIIDTSNKDIKYIVCFDSTKQVCKNEDNIASIIALLKVPAYEIYEIYVQGGKSSNEKQ